MRNLIAEILWKDGKDDYTFELSIILELKNKIDLQAFYSIDVFKNDSSVAGGRSVESFDALNMTLDSIPADPNSRVISNIQKAYVKAVQVLLKSDHTYVNTL